MTDSSITLGAIKPPSPKQLFPNLPGLPKHKLYFANVFSNKQAKTLPLLRLYDCSIGMLSGTFLS